MRFLLLDIILIKIISVSGMLEASLIPSQSFKFLNSID